MYFDKGCTNPTLDDVTVPEDIVDSWGFLNTSSPAVEAFLLPTTPALVLHDEILTNAVEAFVNGELTASSLDSSLQVVPLPPSPLLYLQLAHPALSSSLLACRALQACTAL